MLFCPVVKMGSFDEDNEHVCAKKVGVEDAVVLKFCLRDGPFVDKEGAKREDEFPEPEVESVSSSECEK